VRLVPRRWSSETWICSLRGHVTPAADVQELRPSESGVGIDLPDGRRLARCLRCDMWLAGSPPGPDAPEHLPPFEELPRPRRGRALDDAVLLRVIAIERGIHSLAFTLLAIGLVLLETNLTHLQNAGRRLAGRLNIVVSDTGQQASRSFVSRGFGDLLRINHTELKVLLTTAVIYAVVEGVEAVGLWRERRWAEYLTAAATVGFLPFEIIELAKRVTVFRVSALLINLAVLVWLVWNKRLFGIRGGSAALEEASRRQSLEALQAIEHPVAT
jgi:uncharacterized membrane protein (DUF2068 family)